MEDVRPYFSWEKNMHVTCHMPRLTTCHLQAQILATIMIAGKYAKLFFFKIPNFLVIQPKNISITSLEHLETNSSTQNTQKHSKKLKSKPG